MTRDIALMLETFWDRGRSDRKSGSGLNARNAARYQFHKNSTRRAP